MAENITLNPGSGGDILKARDLGTNIKLQNVELQDAAGQGASFFPVGFMRTTDEPRQLFYDPFEGVAVDTTDRWTSTSAGGGQAAAVSAGNMTIGSGTTINGYAYLDSKSPITPTVPGWLGTSFALSLSVAPASWTNALGFWGVGSVTAAPTSAAPVLNGYGFELTETGVMRAVVYANGTRTTVATLTNVTDTALHRYIITYRTDRIYWFIDTTATPVATANFVSPTVQVLPIKMEVVAHSVAPGASRVLTVAGVASWDTAKQNTTLSDGTFPWRKAQISTGGALSTMTAPQTALTSKTAQYTTTQTGVALWTPAAGKKIVITSYQIQVGGTTAGTVQLWFGASGDTTYTRGTDLAIFDGEFAPSATQKPGIAQSGMWVSSTADHVLRVTDSAAINPITVTVWGYEI